MKILVVSDTHFSIRNLLLAVEKEHPDKIFHLGDVQGKDLEIEAITELPLTVVRGNCDSDLSLPSEVLEEVGNHRAFLTHGHYYGVGTEPEDWERIIAAAKEKKADMVLFGHTHVPTLTLGYQGMTIMNPGSISSPRQESQKYTYGIIKILENGEVECALKALK